MRIPLLISTLIGIVAIVNASTKSVLLYQSKVGQLVTSTTLFWQSYTGDSQQLEFAVEAAEYYSDKGNYSMYVCRQLIEGIFVTGHTQKRDETRTVCVVTMHTEVHTHHVFDVLINKGNGGKVAWKPWSKFSATIPTGAVSATSSGHAEDNYVARRKAHTSLEHGQHHHHGGVDYNVGRYAPKQGLGKVVVNINNSEKEYEDGEILCESEPVRYELRDIKKDKWRTHIVRNETVLGSATLSNDGDYSNTVETAISYIFDKVVYWGTYEGVARGLPTKVFENNKESVDLNKGWGLKVIDKRTEVKQVSASLQPGTAMNVTLMANYTKIEAPYKAKLRTYYADSDEPKIRDIEATVQTADMLDIHFVYSPIYWQHNLTLVPTTTTTTTTTTSTTTTTTTTTEATTTNKLKDPSVIGVRGDFIDSNDIDESTDAATEAKLKQLSSETNIAGLAGSTNQQASAGSRLVVIGASSASSVIVSFCGAILFYSTLQAQSV